MHVNFALALSQTVDKSKILDSGPVVSQGHWSEQDVCPAPAAQTSAAMNVVEYTQGQILTQTFLWALFPGYHSGITTTILIGRLPAGQGRASSAFQSSPCSTVHAAAICIRPNKWKTGYRRKVCFYSEMRGLWLWLLMCKKKGCLSNEEKERQK